MVKRRGMLVAVDAKTQKARVLTLISGDDDVKGASAQALDVGPSCAEVCGEKRALADHVAA